MEQKITLPELANMLALQSGESPELCKTFLRSLFNNVSAALESGETAVKVRGFGIFKIVDVDARMSVNVASGEDMEIPPHRKVVFNPSKELAALVNAPFEMFEAVEVSDEAAEEIETVESAPVAATADDSDNTESEVSETVEISEITEETVSADDSESNENNEDAMAPDMALESEEPEEPEESKNSDDTKDTDDTDETDTEETTDDSEAAEEAGTDVLTDHRSEYVIDDYTEETHRKHERGYRFMWGFFAGFISALVAVGVGVAVFYVFGLTDTINRSLVVPIVTEAPATQEEVTDKSVAKAGDADETSGVKEAAETELTSDAKEAEAERQSAEKAEQEKAKAQVATTPSDEKVYDTITKTRYLTTMAKDHYGNYNLWPYIYEENKNILGHPDRIRPGTQVVIPKLSKYGVNPNSEEDIRIAKRKGVEIYARYK